MRLSRCETLFIVAFAVGSLLVHQGASAHTRQVSPTPRNNNAGLKTPPCGGVPAGTDTSKYQVLEMGKAYNMTLEETIQHPGKFIYNLLDKNGNMMAPLVTVTDDINKGMKTISVPMDPAKGVAVCNDCILQLIQRMEENPANPTFYYSCADVKIVAAGSNAPPLPPVTTTPTSGSGDTGGLQVQCSGH